MLVKWKQLTLIGLMSLLLAACNAENNDNEDLQNGNPAVGGNDDTEEPSDDTNTTEDLEDDVEGDEEQED